MMTRSSVRRNAKLDGHAAEYLRMSREHQRYSLAVQSAAKRTYRLQHSPRRNPREEWIFSHMFPPIVDPKVFASALLVFRGHLTASLIDQAPHLPHSAYVRKMFGTLTAAYQAAGWEVDQATARSIASRRRWARTSADCVAQETSH